jgi:hypothetical protein
MEAVGVQTRPSRGGTCLAFAGWRLSCPSRRSRAALPLLDPADGCCPGRCDPCRVSLLVSRQNTAQAVERGGEVGAIGYRPASPTPAGPAGSSTTYPDASFTPADQGRCDASAAVDEMPPFEVPTRWLRLTRSSRKAFRVGLARAHRGAHQQHLLVPPASPAPGYLGQREGRRPDVIDVRA